jgi:hypothetical protein
MEVNNDNELKDDFSNLSDDEINKIYGDVLDHMLLPPHIKSQLMDTETQEKKLQTVKLNKNLLINVDNNWGESQNILIKKLLNTSNPIIDDLILLNTMLRSANKPFMNSFIENNGVDILVKSSDDRLNATTMTFIDATLLYEILCCIKNSMNNEIGMNSFIIHPDAIIHITLSLRFEWKVLTLQILEILAVCCYYSEEAALKVCQGFRLYAKARREYPFACLTQAIIVEDIEVKAAVIQLVNNMVSGIQSTKSRILLRAELSSQSFKEKYEEVSSLIENDSKILLDSSNASSFTEIKSFFGTAIKYKVPTKEDIQISQCGGVLMVAKSLGVRTMWGGKLTKKRWYEIYNDDFIWCIGHDRVEIDGKIVIKGSVPISSIKHIRNFTSNHSISSFCQYSLEIETNERLFELGCDSLEERDKWLKELQSSVDIINMRNSSVKLQVQELTASSILNHIEMFKYQGVEFTSSDLQDRKNIITEEGLDTIDAVQVINNCITLESFISLINFIFYQLLDCLIYKLRNCSIWL